MKGLHNIGNTCYLNAGLQMLIQNKDLCKLIVKNSSESHILTKITEFINEYYTSDKPAIVPSMIKEMMEERKDIFSGSNQQDATEFIVFFFDIIDTELKKQNINIESLFGIDTTTRTKCKMRECLNISNKKEVNNFLLLDMDNSTKCLDDAYRNFKSGEKLDGDNMYYCDKCKEKRIASKRYNIEKWPTHLFIWLKRFKQNGHRVSKLGQPLSIPVEWRYDNNLHGAVIHYGNINGGHYVYVGKHKNKWYLFDDSNVTEISDGDELNRLLANAYWLYYQKQ